MALPAYADVNIPRQIVDALRAKEFDVIRAQDDHTAEMEDNVLLIRASILSRVLLTKDTDFFQIAAEWQSLARSFTGIIVLKHDPNATLAQFINDIALILEVEDTRDQLFVVPFPVALQNDPL